MERYIFILAGLLVIVLAGCSETTSDYGQIPQNRNTQMPQDNMTGDFPEGRNFDMMSQESIDACSGKSAGDSCSFETQRGEMGGKCQSNEDILVCVPDFEDMNGQAPGDMAMPPDFEDKNTEYN